MSHYELAAPRHRDQRGEGPIWSRREQAVYWADILGRAVNRLDIGTGIHSRTLIPSSSIGCIIERSRFVAGLGNGFAELTLEPLGILHLSNLEPACTNNRMNDAKVDASGRIWAGTMYKHAAAPTGNLYRLDPDLTWQRMDGGIT